MRAESGARLLGSVSTQERWVEDQDHEERGERSHEEEGSYVSAVTTPSERRYRRRHDSRISPLEYDSTLANSPMSGLRESLYPA